MSRKGRPPRLESSPWRNEPEAALAEVQAELRGKQLRPLTDGQGLYFEALKSRSIILCSGPAGSGKTWVACGKAAQMLVRKEIKKIVLTRPLVQCGRGYGYRKGDFEEKVGPYFRPLLDTLNEFLPPAEVERRRHDGTVELLPLEDMRGTTLKNSFVICDEAQNAEYFQLHMLLTRFGPDSKFVVIGDVSRTQIDTQARSANPFKEIIGKIKRRGGHPKVGYVELTRKDIVRHSLVQWVDETLADDWEAGAPAREVKCPHCGSGNWYDAGDEADADYADPLGVVCWECGAGIGLWGPDDEYLPHVTKRQVDYFLRGRKA